jgi:hypothetical protein
MLKHIDPNPLFVFLFVMGTAAGIGLLGAIVKTICYFLGIELPINL